MSFKPKKLTVAVMAALGTISLAQAQTATTEKTVITGSNIKRVDAEPVAPVDIITREQIERTGLPTVADVLRNIPANTSSFSESFSNSFARGASGIALRALGQKTTLVLINGRRTSGYGFAQNIQDTFVDINSIPTAAVERIEILKDGASAIYGSDAIAGVVNIILRRDFRGLEASGDYGWFEGKHDKRATLSAGIGDLGKDRFNVFGVLDYYKRDHLLWKDTEYAPTRDMRGYAGGRNDASFANGGTWRQLTATGALTQNFRAMTECPGILMNGVQAAQAGYIDISNPANYPGSQSTAAYNTNLARASASNTYCNSDSNQAGLLSALPGTERTGFLARGTLTFTPAVEGYAELALSRVESNSTFTPRFFEGNTALRPFPTLVNVNFAPGVGGNPFNTPARILGNQYAWGPLNFETDSDTGRVLAGVKFAFAGWDGDSAAGYAKNKAEDRSINAALYTELAAVLGIPTTPQPPIPTSTATAINFDRPSLTPRSVYDSFLTTSVRKSESKLSFADIRLSSEQLPNLLPGGPIGIAFGLETRKEELQDRPETREILGSGKTATDGSRTQYAGFLELALPVTRQLEAQAAVRYDHYSDFGNATTPKLGLKFKAMPWLLLRANWGRGFRAPTLPEISPSRSTFFTQVNDPATGQQGVQIAGTFAGNPQLSAEKSESSTLGIVFEPSANFNIGLNFYEVYWKNQVTAGSFQRTVDDCASEAPPANCSTTVFRDPATGVITAVSVGFFNQPSTITRGIDIDGKYSLSTGFGRFTARLNATYVDTFKEDGLEEAGRNDGLITTVPRLKGQFSLDWDRGPLSITGQVNYIHGYHQGLLPGSRFVLHDPSFQTGVYPDRIPKYWSYNLYGKYQLTKNLAVYGSVVNLTNEKPPYDPGVSSTFLYDFTLYDPRGRQFHLGVNYKM